MKHAQNDPIFGFLSKIKYAIVAFENLNLVSSNLVEIKKLHRNYISRLKSQKEELTTVSCSFEFAQLHS